MSRNKQVIQDTPLDNIAGAHLPSLGHVIDIFKDR